MNPNIDYTMEADAVVEVNPFGKLGEVEKLSVTFTVQVIDDSDGCFIGDCIDILSVHRTSNGRSCDAAKVSYGLHDEIHEYLDDWIFNHEEELVEKWKGEVERARFPDA